MDNSILLVGNFLSQKVYTRSVGEELALRLEENGWQVYTTSGFLARLPRLIDMITTVISLRSKYRVALVEVYSGMAFLWAEAVCGLLKRLGKPYIAVLHGGNLPAFANRYPQRVNKLLSNAAVVVTPSNYLQVELQQYKQEIIQIPNPLDIRKYSFHLRSRPEPRLIWLRSFHRIYNPLLAVRVLNLLRESYQNVHLAMIGFDKGDGSLQKVEEYINDHGLQNHVSIVRGVPKNEVPEKLSKGDIFMNTTNIDNTPVSVIEAMACGLCVVSTNVGGIPYLLHDGEDALLVPLNDAEAMANAIRRILTEPGLAERLSHNARKKAEQFDWSVVLPQWEKLLSEVIDHA